MDSQQTLLQWIDTYELENEIGKQTARQYRIAVRNFERWAAESEGLGSGIPLGELTPTLLNKFLVCRQEQGLSAKTRSVQRGAILTLWRYAADCGLADAPRRIRGVKVPRTLPEAWTVEDARKLLNAADQIEGYFSKTGIKKSLFWKAFVMAAWDSAMRLSDLLSVERSWIRDDGGLGFYQQKTGHGHVVKFRAATVAAIDATYPPNRSLCFPLWASRYMFYESFRQLAKQAGLEGTSKKLRKSSASAVERIQPGSAWKHLGHTAPGLDRRSYIDPRIANTGTPQPPALE